MSNVAVQHAHELTYMYGIAAVLKTLPTLTVYGQLPPPPPPKTDKVVVQGHIDKLKYNMGLPVINFNFPIIGYHA